MAEVKKADLKSMDIPEDKLRQLKQVFPEVFTEGFKIDLDKLRMALGENVEIGKERFGMNWPGKADCFKIIQAPSVATLVPAKDESVNFDTTENLFIEGDNLEVLKLLQKSYYGKIRMIYIDPPYNTGKEFIYPDNFTESLDTYLRYSGQIDDQGRKYSTNAETDGRFHSKWINMIYPRLYLARNLLSDDGVIFISIDDHEIDNLMKVCNELFGEDNHLATLPTVMNLKGNNDQFAFAGTHEYTLVFSKKMKSFNPGELSVDEEAMDDWKEDEIGYYKRGANLKATGQNAPRDRRPNLWFPLYVSQDNKCSLIRQTNSDTELLPITNGKEMSWRWSKEKFINSNGDVIVVRDGDSVSLYKKQRPALGELPSKKPKSLFYKPEYSSGNGTAAFKDLLGEKLFNAPPKPPMLIKDFLRIGSGKDSIILDFFAGSGTTAQAIMELNKEDEGKRRYILIQLSENLDLNNKDQKAGAEYCDSIGKPRNIAEIAKERIRRFATKVAGDQNGQLNFNNKSIDVGFKVFHLSQSNFKVWEGSADPKKEVVEKQLVMHVDHINPKSSQDDILFELLLKAGFELTTKIEAIVMAGKTVYSIEGGLMLICLEKELTKEVVKAIAEKAPSRVICLDKGFDGNDQLKTNAVQIMKSKGVEDFRTV